MKNYLPIWQYQKCKTSFITTTFGIFLYSIEPGILATCIFYTSLIHTFNEMFSKFDTLITFSSVVSLSHNVNFVACLTPIKLAKEVCL